MDPTLIAGLIIILTAYVMTCLLIFKSKKIIAKINQKRLNNIRDIRKELGL